MAKHLPLVYCFDDNYAKFAVVSILSAMRNCSAPLKVYCISLFSDPAKLPALQATLDSMGVDAVVMAADAATFDGWTGYQHITKAAYLRLLIPDMVKEERVIYVDCDTIVSGDLQALYDQPMGEYALGGVVDPSAHLSSKVPRSESDVYLNSGVLLMDLVKLRADDFFNKCRDIYGRYREQVTWCDQCIINKYAENNKLILNEEWNTQIPTNIFSKTRWNALIEAKTAKVLHFVGSVKPWMEWCNPCIATYWWSYANDVKVDENLRVPFTKVEHMIFLSQTLDLNEDHEQASQVKSSIIAHLLNKLKVS